MIELHVSPEALSDMAQIKRYIEEELENPDAAMSTLARIAQAMRSLTHSPDRGAPLSARLTQNTNYRYLLVGNYLLFYHHVADEVYVTRVMYKRRDYLRALFRDIQEIH